MTTVITLTYITTHYGEARFDYPKRRSMAFDGVKKR